MFILEGEKQYLLEEQAFWALLLPEDLERGELRFPGLTNL